MAASCYWVELHTEDGIVLGAGFYFTGRYLLTAAHCLQDLPADQHRVVIKHTDGSSACGLVCARDSEADLALISLIGPASVRPPLADVCERGDRWRTPNRPSPSDPHLSGVVDEPSAMFHCDGGAVVKVLQLQSALELRDYRGYSGSAIERVNREPALAGVLQEQYRDRLDGSQATNVLFAVTMHEAIERFADYFQHNGSSLVASQQAPRPTPAAELLATYTEMLKQAKDWLAQGLMSPAQVEMIQVNIARTIVDSTTRQVAP